MPSDLVFQGDFSFVNTDATSLSTLPHRQQVTKHVHGYRRWKKGQEARRLRESSKFHEVAEGSSRSQQIVPRRRLQDKSATQIAAAPPSPGPIRSLPPLIDVVLLNGNSDPFDALPGEVTATVNSLLSFERDCIFPSVRELELRMTAKENVSREVAFTNTWINESKGYLYDSIAIHSYLARIATHRYMFTSQPEFLDAAHEFRRKGVAALKQYMTSPDVDVLRLYRGLLILLWADSSLGDRDAFTHHITVLKDIFHKHHETLTSDSNFNLHHFVSVVYFEVQDAVMNLARTSLDVGHNEWVEKQFEPLWNQMSPSFSFPRLDADRNLDPLLEGGIRRLYLDVQQILDIIILMRTRNVLNTSLTWFYAITRTILTIGRLINLFVEIDVENVLFRTDTTGMTPQAVKSLETACLCLCALYWLRELAGIEHISMSMDIKIFRWNPIMLGQLGRLATAYEGVYMRSTQQLHNAGPLRLLLWVSWTGAMAEQSMFSPVAITGDYESRFTKQFCDLCTSVNIGSESMCQDPLDRFLRLHGMRPTSGDEWYTRCFPPAAGLPP